jgi:sugar phosphate isomerase/epimerase
MATNSERFTSSMRLGLSSYTFGWAIGVRGHEPTRRLDEQGLLDQCVKLGVSLLQIGDNLPLHTFDDARLTRLAERAAGAGVQLEVGARRLVPDRVSDYVRIAQRLGARLIRFVIDDGDYHPSAADAMAMLRNCAPALGDKKLAIENHDRFTAAALREMIEGVGDERIGVCLDTANSLGAGEGIDLVAETLAPLVLNLHVKDFQIERVPHLMGFNVSGRPAGSGMLNVPRLLETVARFRRCETAVLELWTPRETRVKDTIAKEAAWARESINYLKPFFTI